MKKMTEKKGIVIISILMVTVVLLIMTTSMLIIHSSTVGFITTFEKQTMARKLAESGVAYALYSLKNDSQWGDPNDPNCHHITVSVPEVNGKFEIAFNRSASFYSFNNTMNGADPNGGYNNSGVPGYSVDLIVTGTADKVSKKYRVILQADSYYDGAITSGAFTAKAKSITVKAEGDDANTPMAGSIHSNSVLGMIDPNGNRIGGLTAYAIEDKVGTTSFDLYGGVISAQGDINIDANANPNVQVDKNSRARHMKPVDITSLIADANSSATIPKATGQEFVVGPNSVTPDLCADSSAYSVSEGKLTINKDIVFNGDVTIKFDYNSITAGIDASDPNNTTLIKNKIKNANVTMAGDTPSIYVNNGDLAIKGTVCGNGSFYVNGNANYIGENNLVADADPGVAVLATGDVNLKIPSVSGENLDLSMTGLTYSEGNANIEILKSDDDIYPASEGWPYTWTWEEVFASKGGNTSFTTASSFLNMEITSGSGTLKYDKGGTYDVTFSGATDDTKITITYYADANSFINLEATTKEITVGKNTIKFNPDSGPPEIPNTIYDPTFTPPTKLYYKLHAALKGELAKPIYPGNTITLSASSPATPTGPKLPPNFHFTGALVAIDPNNPVPSADKPDANSAGNMNIDIGEGNLDITCNSKYLKLLRVVKAGTVFRVVSWTEL